MRTVANEIEYFKVLLSQVALKRQHDDDRTEFTLKRKKTATDEFQRSQSPPKFFIPSTVTPQVLFTLIILISQVTSRPLTPSIKVRLMIQKKDALIVKLQHQVQMLLTESSSRSQFN